MSTSFAVSNIAVISLESCRFMHFPWNNLLSSSFIGDKTKHKLSPKAKSFYLDLIHQWRKKILRKCFSTASETPAFFSLPISPPSQTSIPPLWSPSALSLSTSSPATRRRFRPPSAPTPPSPISSGSVRTWLPRSRIWDTSPTLTSTRQFLYPSEEESCKFIRFLVERLSESSEGGKVGNSNGFGGRGEVKRDEFESYLEDWIEKKDENGVDNNLKKLEAQLNDLRFMSEGSELMNSMDRDAKIDFDDEVGEFDENALPGGSNRKSLSELLDNGQNESKNEESVSEEIMISLKDRSSKTSYEIKGAQDREKIFADDVIAKASTSQDLEELELLKAAAEMAFHDRHHVDFYLEQLREKVEFKKHHLEELNSQWEALRKPLEEEKTSLQKSLSLNNPEAEEKFQKLKEIELETQTVLSDVEKRKDELSRLSKELEKQASFTSRKSYIDRVKEITKNCRKQDTDLERILKDTRELQLESNSIQERLHRTYAIVDEMVFREAKKDPVGRQAYRLLTSIHESFEQISEKILVMNRIRREVAEREKKLAAMASRSLNVDKLQADLDAITRENEHLEKSLQGKEDQ